MSSVDHAIQLRARAMRLHNGKDGEERPVEETNCMTGAVCRVDYEHDVLPLAVILH